MAGAAESRTVEASPNSTEITASLCTACALCCDGALFETVQVDPAEQSALTVLGFTLVQRDGEMAFVQPCSKLRGTCCSVYTNRPVTCRAFRCRLLRRVSNGKVTLSEGLRIVAQAKAQIAAAAAALPGADTIERRSAVRVAAAGGIDRCAAATPDMLSLVVLDRYLDMQFRLSPAIRMKS